MSEVANIFVNEIRNGLSQYNVNLDSRAAIEFFIRHEYQVAVDENMYDEFMLYFPHYHLYKDYESEIVEALLA
jgi:hypothetical protein